VTMCACGRGKALMQGICRACWAARLGASHRVYIWTPALRTELRLACSLRKTERSAAIRALQTKTGWPRYILLREGRRLEASHTRRPWKREDDRLLLAALGEIPIRQIAAMLGRSTTSVKHRAERLQLSGRIRDGFCVTDLSRLLGLPRYRIDELISQGLLGKPARVAGAGTRISDTSVTQFIRSNPQLIDFRLADQTFLKDVLFGA
jgi:hypothetical protein